MLAMKAASQSKRRLTTPFSRSSSKGLGGGSSCRGRILLCLCMGSILVLLGVAYLQTSAEGRRGNSRGGVGARTTQQQKEPERRIGGAAAARQGQRLAGGGQKDQDASPVDAAMADLDELLLKNGPKESLVLKTSEGDVKIQLRPKLSEDSSRYIQDLVASGCKECRLYRAEKEGILQGILKGKPDVKPVERLGDCPPEYQGKQQNCPKHDPHCGCHGPTMTRGMVGWAGGAKGPDFFISNYRRPATWWGQQHTVFGEIVDVKSLENVDKILALPATNRGGMTFLDKTIHFEIELVKS